MIENNENKIWGPAITMKQINVHIPRKHSYKWEKLRELYKNNESKEQSIQLSPDGGLHMINICLKIDSIFIPLARKLGYEPLSFTEERVDILCELLESCIDDDKVENIIQSRKSLLEVIDKQIKFKMNGIVKQ